MKRDSDPDFLSVVLGDWPSGQRRMASKAYCKTACPPFYYRYCSVKLNIMVISQVM